MVSTSRAPVSGRGEVFKSGGRVVKNVTGYDLPKLLAALEKWPETGVPDNPGAWLMTEKGSTGT